MNPGYVYLMIPIGGIVAVVINQYIVHDYFVGKLRGAFEYVYRESLIKTQINTEIHRSLTFGTDFNELESLAVYKSIMSRVSEYDEEARFFAFLAAGHAANVGSEWNNELAALKQAVALRPADLIANYRLARVYERLGAAQDAIKAYEASVNDPSIDPEELRAFLMSQTNRVKEKGPQQASPIPGLIYQLM
jgi:tetratricopeptide (TPR) repeat protein